VVHNGHAEVTPEPLEMRVAPGDDPCPEAYASRNGVG
jgi:hypothetical protein